MIHVLRLGHRIGRDRRISTHSGLVSRALGAGKLLYTGERDNGLEDSIKRVSKQWGGRFEISWERDYKKIITNYKKKGYKVVHLTVYGIPIQKRISQIRKKRVLVVVGGEKVPPEVYQLSDMNISITSQPHSEIAALSIFLHEYFQGRELKKRFKNARIRLVPQERGKKILKKGAR